MLESRKDARWIYYRRPDNPGILVKKVLALVESSLMDDEQAKKDRETVRKILCTEKKQLYKTQERK